MTKYLIMPGRVPCQRSEPQAHRDGCQDLDTFSCPMGFAQGQSLGRELLLSWATGDCCAMRVCWDGEEDHRLDSPCCSVSLLTSLRGTARLGCCPQQGVSFLTAWHWKTSAGDYIVPHASKYLLSRACWSRGSFNATTVGVVLFQSQRRKVSVSISISIALNPSDSMLSMPELNLLWM